jgi:hypothetical protein
LVKGTGKLLIYTYAGKSHTSEEKHIVCYLNPVHIEEWGKQLHENGQGPGAQKALPTEGRKGEIFHPQWLNLCSTNHSNINDKMKSNS